MGKKSPPPKEDPGPELLERCAWGGASVMTGTSPEPA